MTDARDPAASFDAEIACHTRWKTSERTNAENPSIVRRHDGIAALATTRYLSDDDKYADGSLLIAKVS
jgi:hypothetical protein